MNPSKLSTMYTCIMLERNNIRNVDGITSLTFDLPLAKTREMVLAEGQLTLLSGVSIRLGGFHYLLLSWVRSVTGNGTDASSIYTRPFITRQ